MHGSKAPRTGPTRTRLAWIAPHSTHFAWIAPHSTHSHGSHRLQHTRMDRTAFNTLAGSHRIQHTSHGSHRLQHTSHGSHRIQHTRMDRTAFNTLAWIAPPSTHSQDRTAFNTLRMDRTAFNTLRMDRTAFNHTLYINTVSTTWCEAPAQLFSSRACWLVSCFRNPPSSDMDYRICNVRKLTWSFLRGVRY